MKNVRQFFLLILLGASISQAQNESRLHRDFRVEGEALKACAHFSFGSLTDCGQTLVMGQPIHIAVGSLAPDNGMGFGLAFVEHKNFANEWRTSFNVDAQATTNGSWRAGAYMKAYRLPGGTQYKVAPLFNFYSQSTSLNRVDYFGLGPNTLRTSQTTYGFSENITGTNMALPFKIGSGGPKAALIGELNARYPSVRSGSTASIPSIGQRFTEATAPGLTRQKPFFQPGFGLRVYPALFKDHIRLDYLAQIQFFHAAGDSAHSFRRANFDFRHEIPLYSLLPASLAKHYYSTRSAVFINNGPNDCTGTNASRNVALKDIGRKINDAVPCPVVSTTQKLEGSIRFRTFISESIADRGSAVPFYFSPTIGGSNLDGTGMLTSYPDYRFRGPNLLLFRGEVEHSLGKLPIGLYFAVDEGKIGLQRNDISLDHFRHSYTTGLTVHAGGLPVIYFTFAWGGNEGTHTGGTISPFLLGGSSLPSLF